MPRPNYTFQGIRFFKSMDGSDKPRTIEGYVASNYATALYPGDPVARQSDGSYARVAAGGGAGISAVVHRILKFKDSAGILRTNAKLVPANTTWTAWSERTLLELIPVKGAQFLMCANAIANATLATGAAYGGENADHAYATADAGLGISPTVLDIATHNTTNTLQWRLIDLLQTDNDGGSMWNDPTQTGSVWIVEANVFVDVTAGGSATGV